MVSSLEEFFETRPGIKDYYEPYLRLNQLNLPDFQSWLDNILIDDKSLFLYTNIVVSNIRIGSDIPTYDKSKPELQNILEHTANLSIPDSLSLDHIQDLSIYKTFTFPSWKCIIEAYKSGYTLFSDCVQNSLTAKIVLDHLNIENLVYFQRNRVHPRNYAFSPQRYSWEIEPSSAKGAFKFNKINNMHQHIFDRNYQDVNFALNEIDPLYSDMRKYNFNYQIMMDHYSLDKFKYIEFLERPNPLNFFTQTNLQLFQFADLNKLLVCLRTEIGIDKLDTDKKTEFMLDVMKRMVLLFKPTNPSTNDIPPQVFTNLAYLKFKLNQSHVDISDVLD